MPHGDFKGYFDAHSTASTPHTKQWRLLARLRHSIARTGRHTVFAFLPQDYPTSVTPAYKPYSQWQFVHNVAGTVTSVLATQSMLFAMGLGAGSIPLAAALNWVIKDGLGQLGGVLYACKVSNRFDSDPKHYKFWAGITLQAATLLEMLTPLFPAWFLAISSASNIGKNMAWLATSAARAQIHQSFALANNLGDITAKSGSQSTAAGLIGTGLGITMGALCSSSVASVLALYLPLATVSVYANYTANVSIISQSLNVQRAELVLYHWLQHILPGTQVDWTTPFTIPRSFVAKAALLTPHEVATQERFVRRPLSPWRHGSALELEPSVYRIAHGTRRKSYRGLLALEACLTNQNFAHSEQYVLYPCTAIIRGLRIWELGSTPAPLRPILCLWYRETATPHDILRGFYHGCIVRHLLGQNAKAGSTADDVAWRELMAWSHGMACQTYSLLLQGLHALGWRTDVSFILRPHGRISLID
ncbi:hypothetical protein H4R35_005140 [Dimargaris xerosporica]|nr:hypothetical protein H4R35_005140 [Dimargaris xerosporica]